MHKVPQDECEPVLGFNFVCVMRQLEQSTPFLLLNQPLLRARTIAYVSIDTKGFAMLAVMCAQNREIVQR